MKYVILVFFNAIALYILAVFLFGNGGMIDSIRHVQEIGRLERQKIINETELEDLKSRLNYLDSLKGPNATALLSQGRKVDNLVIFKFTGEKEKEENFIATDNGMVMNRIYLSVILILAMILAGNIALLVNMKRTAH